MVNQLFKTSSPRIGPILIDHGRPLQRIQNGPIRYPSVSPDSTVDCSSAGHQERSNVVPAMEASDHGPKVVGPAGLRLLHSLLEHQ